MAKLDKLPRTARKEGEGMAMINADFEIKRQLLKTTATLRNTLKACIDTVAKT